MDRLDVILAPTALIDEPESTHPACGTVRQSADLPATETGIVRVENSYCRPRDRHRPVREGGSLSAPARTEWTHHVPSEITPLLAGIGGRNTYEPGRETVSMTTWTISYTVEPTDQSDTFTVENGSMSNGVAHRYVKDHLLRTDDELPDDVSRSDISVNYEPIIE